MGRYMLTRGQQLSKARNLVPRRRVEYQAHAHNSAVGVERVSRCLAIHWDPEIDRAGAIPQASWSLDLEWNSSIFGNGSPHFRDQFGAEDNSIQALQRTSASAFGRRRCRILARTHIDLARRHPSILETGRPIVKAYPKPKCLRQSTLFNFESRRNSAHGGGRRHCYAFHLRGSLAKRRGLTRDVLVVLYPGHLR